VSGLAGLVLVPMDPLIFCRFTDRLVCDVLTFTGDGSVADADEVVGISMLSSAESLVPVYSVFCI
jgi:hypothetical protein